MTISRLLMPAVTLAGALALAGCGGGSGTPGTTVERVTNNEFDPASCLAGTEPNTAGTGCVPTASTAARTAFEEKGGTPGALLIASGVNAGLLNRAAREDPTLASVTDAEFMKLKDSDRIAGLHGSENPGMTWFAALGAGKVALTIGTDDGARTDEGYALKVTGKDTDDFTSGSVGSSAKGATIATGVAYMGIAGRLICNGATCGVDSDKLAGDWYFQAWDGTAVPTGLYVKKGKEYVARSGEPHADWGMWLTDAGTNEPGKEIEWYANAGPTVANSSLNEVAGLPDEATYTGDAVGISTLFKSGDTAAKVGQFTADAELTVTFDDTQPTLGGKISNFVGDAVGDWELTLKGTAPAPAANITAGAVANGVLKAGGAPEQAGGWRAELYGKANSRPSGVVGDFDGRFSDGQAVGVFHAK